jgi:hypothetical protein
MNIIASKWKNLDKETKDKYKALRDEETKLYATKKKEYEASYGKISKSKVLY